MAQRQFLINDSFSQEWAETIAYQAEIERNEAERGKPQPVIVPADWQNIVTLVVAFLMGCTLGGLFG